MISDTTADKLRNQRVPILVYHHVYEQHSPELKQATFETGAGIIGETEFRRQMEYIVDLNWTVVSTNANGPSVSAIQSLPA